MATTETTNTAATPAPAAAATTLVSSIESTVKADTAAATSWLKLHERIVLTALVLVAGSIFGDHYLNVTAAHDAQTAQIAAQQLTEQKAQDAQLATQIAQSQQAYSALQTQLTLKDAQLASAMANRTVVLQQADDKDQTLPLPSLGTHLATLTGVDPSHVTATPTGLDLDDTGAREVTEQLEQVPVLKANLQDETTLADNQQQEITSANNLITGYRTQVDALNKTVLDGEKACTAKIAAVKAADNKAKGKWFKTGFGLGFVVGFLTGHKL